MFFYTACFAVPSVLFWDILVWIKKLEIYYTLLFFLGFSSIRRNLFGANRIVCNSWRRTTFLTQIHLDMLCDKPYYDVIEVILVLMFISDLYQCLSWIWQMSVLTLTIFKSIYVRITKKVQEIIVEDNIMRITRLYVSRLGQYQEVHE